VYRSALAAVQRRIAAAGGSVPLSGLFHALAEFRSLLPPLHQLLHTVTARGITGAPLLHMLHAKVPRPAPIAWTYLAGAVLPCAAQSAGHADAAEAPAGVGALVCSCGCTMTSAIGEVVKSPLLCCRCSYDVGMRGQQPAP